MEQRIFLPGKNLGHDYCQIVDENYEAILIKTLKKFERDVQSDVEQHWMKEAK